MGEDFGLLQSVESLAHYNKTRRMGVFALCGGLGTMGLSWCRR